MRIVDIIEHKRDGKKLSGEEIRFFVKGFTKGDIADYQASALAMAICLRGMDERETTALTLAMADSGQRLDLSSVAPHVLDKHSSGGVGDKTSLVVGPMIAAAGLPFGKMSGRGLGFSGGTLDKLESIPGFRSDLTSSEFISQLRKHGIVISGQTHELAPADGKLYALRDVTATVDSLPLIASSIMSKKIAAGANVILLDVKVGRGAFMKTESDATLLAELMVKIGRLAGESKGQPVTRRVGAVISDMNQPLGNAVGNAVEVIEAIETLKGHGPADFTEHCIVVATLLLLLAEAEKEESTARARIQKTLSGGAAMSKFKEWIDAQGGKIKVVDDYGLLPQAEIVRDIGSPADGYISEIDAEEVGLTAVDLGGGRTKKGEEIDRGVGIVFKHKVGERVRSGEPLFTLAANDQGRFDAAESRLLAAYSFSSTPPPTPPLIHKIIK